MALGCILGHQSADENRNRLQVIARIGGMWLRGLANGNIQRSSVVAMMELVDAMVSQQDYSDDSLGCLSGLFCENCRNIQPQVSSLCARKVHSSRDALSGCYLMSVAN
jgi:hypothetical protein